jgi:hypothetical protein
MWGVVERKEDGQVGFVLRDWLDLPVYAARGYFDIDTPNLDMPKHDHYTISLASAIGPFQNVKFHFTSRALAEAPSAVSPSRFLGVPGTQSIQKTHSAKCENLAIQE